MRQPSPQPISGSSPQRPLARGLSKELQDLVQETGPERLHATLRGLHDRIEEEMDRHTRTMAAIYDVEGERPGPIRHAHSANSILSSSSSCGSAPAPFVGGTGGGGGGGAAAPLPQPDAGDEAELAEEDLFFYATAGPEDLSVLLDGPDPSAAAAAAGADGGTTGDASRRPESGSCQSPFLLGGENGDEEDVLAMERVEKSIFVKAALQLLVERAATGPPAAFATPGPDGAGGIAGMMMTMMMSSSGSAGGTTLSPLLARTGRIEEAGAGAKRAGFLRKANHHSMGTIWRTKYVECYPGLLVYVDDDALLGRR